MFAIDKYERITIETSPAVELVFNKYPELVRKKLLNLRKLIIETASEAKEITSIEETLKWVIL